MGPGRQVLSRVVTVTLKAMLAGLPTIIGMTKDLAELVEKCSPIMRRFFGG